MAGDRPERRSKRRRATTPSAAHYVGYVEDDETPEMIMAKFEALERLQAALQMGAASRTGDRSSGDGQEVAGSSGGDSALSAGPPDPAAARRGAACGCGETPAPAASPTPPTASAPLTEEQLLRLFRETSTFSIPTAGGYDVWGDAAPWGWDAEGEEEDGGGRRGGPRGGARGNDDEGDEDDEDWLDEFFGDGGKGRRDGRGKKGGGGGAAKGGKGAAQGGVRPSGGKAATAADAAESAPAAVHASPSPAPSTCATVSVPAHLPVPRPPLPSARPRPAPRSSSRHSVVIAFNPETCAFVRRRVRVTDSRALEFVRAPPVPLPSAWGRVVEDRLGEGGYGQAEEDEWPGGSEADGARGAEEKVEVKGDGADGALATDARGAAGREPGAEVGPGEEGKTPAAPQMPGVEGDGGEASAGPILDGGEAPAAPTSDGGEFPAAPIPEGGSRFDAAGDFATVEADKENGSDNGAGRREEADAVDLVDCGVDKSRGQAGGQQEGEEPLKDIVSAVAQLPRLPSHAAVATDVASAAVALADNGCTFDALVLGLGWCCEPAWGAEEAPEVLEALRGLSLDGDLRPARESDLAPAARGRAAAGASFVGGPHDGPSHESTSDDRPPFGSLAPWVSALPPPQRVCPRLRPRGEAIAALGRLPVSTLVPDGFVFAFAPVARAADLFELAATWGMAYVENLAWCFLESSHEALRLVAGKDGGEQPPLTSLPASHLTLFIFRTIRRRRETELRHQRSPDVVLSCPVRASLGGPLEVPEDIPLSIETLLPESPGRRLDLWASAGAGRAREVTRVPARDAEALRSRLPREVLERPVAGRACREGWVHLFQG